jgi:hypothetical protein
MNFHPGLKFQMERGEAGGWNFTGSAAAVSAMSRNGSRRKRRPRDENKRRHIMLFRGVRCDPISWTVGAEMLVLMASSGTF